MTSHTHKLWLSNLARCIRHVVKQHTRVFFGLLLAVCVAACQNESLEQQVDASILGAAQHGTGCAQGDNKINVSEAEGANGYNPMTSAFDYAFASAAYSNCAKRSGDLEQRTHLNLLSAIASDMAAVRFAMAHAQPETEGAYVSAQLGLAEVQRDTAYASAADKDLLASLSALIKERPERQ